MYITRFEDLTSSLRERISRRREIRSAVDAWVLNEYGIQNFSNLKTEFFGVRDGDTALTLCRQISSATVESISALVISKILDLQLLCPSFIEDIFCSNNTEKRSYVHVKWADYGRKGNTYFRGERIISDGFDECSNIPFSEILTLPHIPGITVPDFHSFLRKKVFGNDVPVDVSEFHRMCMREASKKPNHVFVFDGKKVRKQSILETDTSQSNFRPPAEWYYPLFQSWFADGSMVLLENYEDNKDGKGAETLFQKAVENISAKIGFAPLVLKIPTDDNFLSIPQKFIESPQALVSVIEHFSGKTKGDFEAFFEEVAYEIFSWRS